MSLKTGRLVRQFNESVRTARPEGYILQGSVVRRHLTRTDRVGKKRYGPYYLWTRKVAGKTVTLALSKEQAALIGEAIDRNRILDTQLASIRALSEKIIRAITPGVPMRNRRKQAP